MDKVKKLISWERRRQEETLTLIPSENYVSKAVREAAASVFMNKYAEGYPQKRYYQGNGVVDEIETLAIGKAKKLFKVPHANVQPYSGSPANAAILMALVPPGEKIMGLALSSGGHLTHGHPDITFSGKYYRSVQFMTDSDGIIDYKEVAELARKEKPKLMIVGTTAYPLILNWRNFAQIADAIGAYLVADISHVAGLVLAGVYPSPVSLAHVIMTTTHKTLRGPRGAIIMATSKGFKKDPEIGIKIDRAVFPGLQGGPHANTVAAIAQALSEADTASFRKYGREIIKNAQVLAERLKENGINLVAGGTESHLMVLDLKKEGLGGKETALALEEARIIVNKNTVPGDTKPANPAGIRIGTPAVTTRGLKEPEMKLIADWITAVIRNPKDLRLRQKVAGEVLNLCKKFPLR